MYKKWKWTLEKYSRGIFQPIFTGWGHIEGYTRNYDKAYEKGRKEAAKYCEDVIKRNKRMANRKISYHTVTCEDEPV